MKIKTLAPAIGASVLINHAHIAASLRLREVLESKGAPQCIQMERA
jgi:hypothetical protein